MSASINVSLVNTTSAKTQQVTLPRSVTVAELSALAGKKNVSFSVDGCTPAPSTTLGDLYDMCAKQEVLEVKFNKPIRLGAGFSCCTPCASVGYDAQVEKEINKAVANIQDQINAQGGTDAIVRDILNQQQQQ